MAFSQDGQQVLIGIGDPFDSEISIICWNLPWSSLKQNIETYSLSELTTAGLQFVEEDVLEMEKRTGKKVER